MPPLYVVLSLMTVAAVAVTSLVIAVELKGTDADAAPDATDAPLVTHLDNRGNDLGCPISYYYFPGDVGSLRSSLPKSITSRDATQRTPIFTQWVAHEKGWEQTNWVEFTVQSNSTSSIILTKISINVISDVPLTSRTKVADSDGCGSPGVPRTFQIDFGNRSPLVTAVSGQDDDGKPAPAVRFPFKVSATDPEIFDLAVADGPPADIQWTATLAYTQNGQGHEATIDDGGKPFHSVPHDDVPLFELLDGRISG